jgi:hypothetical protein
MKYAVRMGPGAMFRKDWLKYSTVDRGYTDSKMIS